MSRCLLLLIFTFSISICSAESIDLGGNSINFKVRESNYNDYVYDQGRGKLSVDVEVSLVVGRLPNEKELASVSERVLQNQRKAYMTWVFFYLPEMKSGSGAYASDHRAPNPEGIKIMEYGL